MSESELILRELLWRHHGCDGPALYGDDGEMQCNACGIDFRRDSAERIKAIWYDRGMKMLIERGV